MTDSETSAFSQQQAPAVDERIGDVRVVWSQPGGHVEVGEGGIELPVALIGEGPGVPKDALQNIFSPFFRINGPGRQSEGNGLGLAIALEAIRLHHGSITASNLNPEGPEISVRLPVSDPAGGSALPRH